MYYIACITLSSGPGCPCSWQGLLHRTVYVLLEDAQGRWLLQRRHAAKAVAGGCWDLSAAEHLAPGEAYDAAALRGLREELGIAPEAVRGLRQVLPPSRRSLVCTTVAGKAISDQEWVPLFGGVLGDGQQVRPDGLEVAEVRWVAPQLAAAEAQAAPHEFTPWFRGASSPGAVLTSALSLLAAEEQSPLCRGPLVLTDMRPCQRRDAGALAPSKPWRVRRGGSGMKQHRGTEFSLSVGHGGSRAASARFSRIYW